MKKLKQLWNKLFKGCKTNKNNGCYQPNIDKTTKPPKGNTFVLALENARLQVEKENIKEDIQKIIDKDGFISDIQEYIDEL